MPSEDSSPAVAPPPLPLFALLETPYGMSAALTTVVPMYLMRTAGIGIAQAGAMTAFCGLPMTFYFAYAPIVDSFMRRRTWWAWVRVRHPRFVELREEVLVEA